MEEVIKYLVEMSKTRDEIALDLEQVAIRLNSLELAFRVNRDTSRLAVDE